MFQCGVDTPVRNARDRRAMGGHARRARVLYLSFFFRFRVVRACAFLTANDNPGAHEATWSHLEAKRITSV